MTKRQHKALQAYVDLLRPMLGLSDWCITVKDDEAPDDAMAFFWAATAQRVAVILVAEDFFDYDPEELRRTVVHELLHAHDAPTFHLIRDTAPLLMSKHRYEGFRSHWEQTNEYATDALATAIAPLFPLPAFP